MNSEARSDKDIVYLLEAQGFLLLSLTHARLGRREGEREVAQLESLRGRGRRFGVHGDGAFRFCLTMVERVVSVRTQLFRACL